VRSESFTIGREAGNDLVLNDVGMSRRHALLTNYGGVVQVADCGSSNGTFVNGRRISGPTDLRDGDVIEVGDGCEITVNLSTPMSVPQVTNAPPPDERASSPNSWGPRAPLPTKQVAPAPGGLNVPIIALSSVVAILLIAVTAVIIRQAVVKPRPGPTPTPTREASTPEDTPTASPNDGQSTSTPAAEPEQARIERYARQLMRRVSSKDTDYPFSPRALEEIAQRVNRFRAQPALPAALAKLSQRSGELTTLARREDLTPALLAYTALAATDGGQQGDPAAAAGRLLPYLFLCKQLLGVESADSSLLVVAASSMPGGSKKTHPLLGLIQGCRLNPATERTVWYLREHCNLGQQPYDFALNFIALGVIAQNPAQFNVSGPALDF
jgi:pSer/pThr/pTyr-binding forkhead associated (FHA) protein